MKAALPLVLACIGATTSVAFAGDSAPPTCDVAHPTCGAAECVDPRRRVGLLRDGASMPDVGGASFRYARFGRAVVFEALDGSGDALNFAPEVSSSFVSLGPAFGVRPTSVARAAGCTRPSHNRAWIRAIGAPRLHTVKDSPLTVALIEGLVRVDHEDIPNARVVRLQLRARANGFDCVVDPRKDRYLNHAMGALGTVAANGRNTTGIRGVSRPSGIIVVDPGEDETHCIPLDHLAQALRCAVSAGADIIAYPRDGIPGEEAREVFATVFREAEEAEAVVVMGAGNRETNLDCCPVWPTSFDGPAALTVTVYRPDGSPGYTGYGAATVDLGMPLSCIYTTGAESPSAYHGDFGWASGATAIAAGTLITMASAPAFRGCCAPQLRDLLVQFAVPPMNPNVRRGISPLGGELNLGFLSDPAVLARRYCAAPAP